jgi:hypothetical protein
MANTFLGLFQRNYARMMATALLSVSHRDSVVACCVCLVTRFASVWPLAGARDKNKMLGKDVMSFLGTRIAGLGLTQCANTAPGTVCAHHIRVLSVLPRESVVLQTRLRGVANLYFFDTVVDVFRSVTARLPSVPESAPTTSPHSLISSHIDSRPRVLPTILSFLPFHPHPGTGCWTNFTMTAFPSRPEACSWYHNNSLYMYGGVTLVRNDRSDPERFAVNQTAIHHIAEYFNFVVHSRDLSGRISTVCIYCL